MSRLKPKVKLTAATVEAWMRFFEDEIGRAVPLLTELDRAIGDGDHGVNIYRGVKAVVSRLDEPVAPNLLIQFRTISAALTSSVGGASGPLYGAFFLQASQTVLQKAEVSLADFAALTDAGCQGVVKLGKASVGDKTMVDTLHAAVVSLRESCHRHLPLREGLHACALATCRAAEATKPLVAKKGRASYLGERSAGTQDPGATSAHLLFLSLAQAVPEPDFTSISTPIESDAL
jgi:dihydroxyacetone kinase-like protein